MADSTAMKVVYKDGIARVQLAGRELDISRHNRDSRKKFCPVELISAALGSWIVLTLSAVAENKQIPLNSLAVVVHRTTEELENISTNFSVDVQLPPGLSDREKVLLFNAARKCDVTKILAGEMRFAYQLIES